MSNFDFFLVIFKLPSKYYSLYVLISHFYCSIAVFADASCLNASTLYYKFTALCASKRILKVGLILRRYEIFDGPLFRSTLSPIAYSIILDRLP